MYSNYMIHPLLSTQTQPKSGLWNSLFFLICLCSSRFSSFRLAGKRLLVVSLISVLSPVYLDRRALIMCFIIENERSGAADEEITEKTKMANSFKAGSNEEVNASSSQNEDLGLLSNLSLREKFFFLFFLPRFSTYPTLTALYLSIISFARTRTSFISRRGAGTLEKLRFGPKAAILSSNDVFSSASSSSSSSALLTSTASFLLISAFLRIMILSTSSFRTQSYIVSPSPTHVGLKLYGLSPYLTHLWVTL